VCSARAMANVSKESASASLVFMAHAVTTLIVLRTVTTMVTALHPAFVNVSLLLWANHVLGDIAMAMVCQSWTSRSKRCVSVIQITSVTIVKPRTVPKIALGTDYVTNQVPSACVTHSGM